MISSKILPGQEETFKFLCQAIRQRKRPERPLVVSVTGIDTAGKTEFSAGLADYLRFHELKVQVVHLDDFHNPCSYRYSAPGDSAEQYYHHSFDLDRLVTEVLMPIKASRSVSVQLKLLDLDTERYDLWRSYEVGPNTVVLLEGVFLLRPELRTFHDLAILLDIPSHEAIHRAKRRDTPRLGRDVLKKYNEKYLKAQRRYFAEVDPYAVADIVIDNVDWKHPRLVKEPDQSPEHERSYT